MAARKTYNFICKSCKFQFGKSLTKEKAREMLAGTMPVCKQCGSADTDRMVSMMSAEDRAHQLLELAKESALKPDNTFCK